MTKNKSLKLFFELFLKYGWLLAFLLFFLLRFPSLWEPFVYGDEGIYLALGQGARRGLTFYRDIHDNKPPLLYLIAAISPTFFAYRFFYFIFSLGGFFIFKKLAEVVFPKQRTAQLLALFTFCIFAAIPLFEGQIGNAENYIIYLSSAAFFLLITKKTFADGLAAGALFALSFLFKVPAGFDLAAAGIVFFLLKPVPFKKILAFWQDKQFWGLLVGFTLPVLLVSLYYLQAGAGADYFRAAFAQNIPYLSSWGQEKTTTGFQLPISLIKKTLIVLLPTAILFWQRQKKETSLAVKISVIWLVCTIFAALLSSRPYPHYLLQAVPALALGAGLLVIQLPATRTLPLIFTLGIWLIFEKYGYYRYPVWDYYQNFTQLVTGQISQQEYLDFWGSWATDLPAIGHYLKTRTSPTDKIFVWSDQPAIYPLSQRLQVGRYTAAYHVKSFDPDYQETLNALNQTPPAYFLVEDKEYDSLHQLKPFLYSSYQLVNTIGPIDLYRLNQD